jgi:hypothetical protein
MVDALTLLTIVMASHTLRILLHQSFGIDVLTFEQNEPQPF